MNDTTHTALCSAHVQLPTDVAAALLSACNPDDLGGIQHKISVSHRFSGASAVACAKSHPLRAEIIATRTEDVDVQQSLLELSTNEMFGKVLRELAKSELVVDHDLVRAIHDRIYQMIRGYDRYSILDRIDLDHALAWLERDATVYGKDLGVLARRVARVLTSTGDLAPAIRFIAACDTGVPGEERDRPLRLELLEAISSFTKELISAGSSQYLKELAAGRSKDVVHYLAITAWSNTEIIDEHVAELTLAQIDAAAFNTQQQSQVERSSREILQYPHALNRTQIRCTDNAWRLIAEQWPGLLLEPLTALVNGDPQAALLTELSLESGRCDLAQRLLDRRFHPEGLRSGPLLNVAQYRIAVRNLLKGVRNVAANTPRPYLSGVVPVSYIPSGTPAKVVLSAWAKHSVHDIVEALSDANRAGWLEWHPTAAEFEQMLDLCSQHEINRAAYEGTHPYTPGNSNRSAECFAASRPYLDAVVARVPASRLLEDDGGITYVSIRLTEEFGDQQEQWLRAWSLAKTSTVPLDAVISAASKLG
jgi:hypothetical protein